MGNSLQSFNFTPNKITRVITDDTCNPWIVAKDVAANLDYNNTSKVGMIFKHVPLEGIKITKVTGKGQVYFINRFLGAITSAVSYTLLIYSSIPLKRPTSPFTYQQDNLYLFKI